ncbi:MAG: hypothetical protein JXA57_20580 [Armatimonadetes bacterium]|nr:hypothetical protein [Armatimonadota bacterium]
MIPDEVLREKMTGWESLGISGGGAMYTPAISPHDPNLILLACDMSGAYRTTDGGESWEMIHYQYLMGNTRCWPVYHPTDPNIIYAGNGYRGGLRISRDRGLTWEPIGEGLRGGPSCLAIDQDNPDCLLAATWDGSYRSEDAGNTWQKIALGRGVAGFHFDRTTPKESRRVFTGTNGGVFVSKDGGKSWAKVGRGLPPKDMTHFMGGSNPETGELVLYCVLESEIVEGEYVGGVYRSTDAGATWDQMMGEGIDTRERERWGRKFAPQYVYVLTTDVRPMTVYACQNRPSQVYRSDDGGESWHATLFTEMDSEQRNLEPNYLMTERGRSESNISGAGINPVDPEMVMTTDWMCAQITRDGGKTWDTVHTNYAPGQGEAKKGGRWVNNGLVVTSVWYYDIDPFEPNRHYICYTDIKFARSEDAGKTWYSQWDEPLRNTTYQLAFDPDTPGKIWGAFAALHDIPNNNVISGRHYWDRAGGGVGLSTDFGKTWMDTSAGLPGKPVVSVVVDPKSPKGARVLYAGIFEGGVYKSTDDGKTWVKKSAGVGSDMNERVCRVLLHQDGTLFALVTALKDTERDVYVPNGPGLYRSRDGGETWECINSSEPLHWPKDFDVDPRDSNVIYLGAADANQQRKGGLYKTTDGGATWSRIAREASETFGASIHPRRPDWIYHCLTETAPGAGLWLSKDGGETWAPFAGIPFRNIQRVCFDPADDDTIYACTFGGSVYRGPAEP